MARILLSALWRNGFVWVGLFTVALEVPGYLDSRHLLGNDWATTVEVANGSAPLLLILAAVAGCLLGASWHLHGDLLRPVPRGAQAILLPGLLVTAVISVVHLAYVAVVLVMHREETIGSLDLRPFVLVVPAILAFSLLGLLLARASTSRLLAPFLGVCLYGVVVITFGTSREGLVSFGGAGVLLTGTRVHVAQLAWQLVWFLAVALVAASMLAIAATKPDRWQPGAAVKVLGGAGMLLLITSAAGVSATHEPDREVATDLVWDCSGDEPQFCVLPGHRQQLVESEPEIREAVRRLSQVDEFRMRARYRERLGGSDDGSGAGQLSLRMLTTDFEIVFRLLAATYLCSDNWNQDQLDSADSAAQLVSAVPLDRSTNLDQSDRAALAAHVSELRC